MQKEKSNTPRGSGKTVSVWLIIKDGKNAGKIALQKRSTKGKSFPYICQSTWAGKVECGESVTDALKRECFEELGKSFGDAFSFDSLKSAGNEKFYIMDERWVCYNYIGSVDYKTIKKVKMHKEAFSKFIMAGKKDKFFPLSSGQNPRNNIVFFDDQYKIIKKIKWK